MELQLDENFFRVRIWRITPAKPRYLRALAELGSGSHRSGVIAGLFGRKPQSVAPTPTNLIHKGLIYNPEYGQTAFSVPQFERYLVRTYPYLK